MLPTGFAVAGGRSERMGRDKALLPWGGATLLDHTLARLREVCAEVRILSGPAARYAGRGVPVDVDLVKGAGPLGGLHAGLVRLGEGLGVFLGVDLPLVTPALLRRLVALAEGYDAVVPVDAGGPQPLCAVYRHTCLDPVRRRIEKGDLKMTSFWSEVRVREAGEADLAGFGDLQALFRNLNTPEDYEAARIIFE